MANSFHLNVHIWKQINLEIRGETGCRKMEGRARRPDKRVELTNLSRNVFSRSAPMHPANPRMNITPPTTMNSQTGSKPPRSVMEEMFDSTPCGPDTSDWVVTSSHPDLKILHHLLGHRNSPRWFMPSTFGFPHQGGISVQSQNQQQVFDHADSEYIQGSFFVCSRLVCHDGRKKAALKFAWTLKITEFPPIKFNTLSPILNALFL